MSPLLVTRPVRFAPQALAAADEQARATGVTPSAFIRAALNEKLGHLDSSAAPVADLAATVAALNALHQKWERQMAAVVARLVSPSSIAAAALPPEDAGLAELTLS
jgi:hypothetical protein